MLSGNATWHQLSMPSDLHVLVPTHRRLRTANNGCPVLPQPLLARTCLNPVLRPSPHPQVKRRRPRARRILLHTATDQTARLVQRDLVGGKGLVHVVSEVLLPLRDPAQLAAKSAKRQKRWVVVRGRLGRVAASSLPAVAAGTEAAGCSGGDVLAWQQLDRWAHSTWPCPAAHPCRR